MTLKVITCDTPLLAPMPFSKRYRLERNMEVKWQYRGKVQALIIPQGYVTDGASIPKPFWSVIGSPYLPEFIAAAIVHDYCCEANWNVTEMSELFFRLLKDANVKNVTAKTMKHAVKVYKSLF
ncbi:DUF1353 domain-containing protein [Shewanella baltica]|uniref:DUF1353 domain-containing protein n=1 Tax=Shewanella baltica TaxID=62322 RepID=UPI003CFF26B5